MSQELIYTSARKGLKIGSHGFCTVASTEGMAPNLADRLEKLTGYRHIHSPNDKRNPVNWTYVTSSIAGQTFHILGRIGDAGLDYTQRTNKIAHLLAMARKELLGTGSAWLMSQPGLLQTEWTGESRQLPARNIPRTEITPEVCNAWKNVMGDAGWAGVLAETIVSEKPRDAYLIYQPPMDLLPLMLEAQSLLSPEHRLDATFSTYFTQALTGTRCRWRCVVKGTPEAARVRKSPQTLILDLTTAPTENPTGKLVELARTGKDTRVPVTKSKDTRLPVTKKTAPGQTIPEQEFFEPPQVPCPPLKPKKTVAGPPPTSQPRRTTSPLSTPPTPQTTLAPSFPKDTLRLLGAAAGVVVVCACIALVVCLVLFSPPKSDPLAKLPPPEEGTKSKNGPDRPVDESGDKQPTDSVAETGPSTNPNSDVTEATEKPVERDEQYYRNQEIEFEPKLKKRFEELNEEFSDYLKKAQEAGGTEADSKFQAAHKSLEKLEKLGGDPTSGRGKLGEAYRRVTEQALHSENTVKFDEYDQYKARAIELGDDASKWMRLDARKLVIAAERQPDHQAALNLYEEAFDLDPHVEYSKERKARRHIELGREAGNKSEIRIAPNHFLDAYALVPPEHQELINAVEDVTGKLLEEYKTEPGNEEKKANARDFIDVWKTLAPNLFDNYLQRYYAIGPPAALKTHVTLPSVGPTIKERKPTSLGTFPPGARITNLILRPIPGASQPGLRLQSPQEPNSNNPPPVWTIIYRQIGDTQKAQQETKELLARITRKKTQLEINWEEGVYKSPQKFQRPRRLLENSILIVQYKTRSPGGQQDAYQPKKNNISFRPLIPLAPLKFDKNLQFSAPPVKLEFKLPEEQNITVSYKCLGFDQQITRVGKKDQNSAEIVFGPDNCLKCALDVRISTDRKSIILSGTTSIPAWPGQQADKFNYDNADKQLLERFKLLQAAIPYLEDETHKRPEVAGETLPKYKDAVKQLHNRVAEFNFERLKNADDTFAQKIGEIGKLANAVNEYVVGNDSSRKLALHEEAWPHLPQVLEEYTDTFCNWKFAITVKRYVSAAKNDSSVDFIKTVEKTNDK